MPATRVTVATEHASRYLQQLCKHWAHKFPVAFTPETGTIDLPSGQTRLRAEPNGLAIEVDAPEAADLDRLETVVADHIKRFAFREDLDFRWQRDA